MVHSGYEATAVTDTVTRPLKAMMVGVRTEGPMAPDVSFDKERPAQYVFSKYVEIKLAEIGQAKSSKGKVSREAAVTH